MRKVLNFVYFTFYCCICGYSRNYKLIFFFVNMNIQFWEDIIGFSLFSIFSLQIRILWTHKKELWRKYTLVLLEHEIKITPNESFIIKINTNCSLGREMLDLIRHQTFSFFVSRPSCTERVKTIDLFVVLYIVGSSQERELRETTKRNVKSNRIPRFPFLLYFVFVIEVNEGKVKA